MKARGSNKLLALRAKAKREGWHKWIRQGNGEAADERAMLNGCWVDSRRIDHWLEFVDEYGTLTEGAFAGRKFDLLDWQATDTSRLFGWVKHSKEWNQIVRRFRFWYEEVPKKNGKTPLLSLIGNYLMFADSDERQINCYLAATTRKQAERCLVHAIRQIKNHPDMMEMASIKKLEGFYSVQYEENLWTVVAADPESADGVNGHCLADELHRWKGHEFFNSLKWMLASQPEGLFAAITTAGADTTGVCYHLHEHTKAVNCGRIVDEQHFGVIYGASKEDDPHDERTWFKANPSLGTTAKWPLKLSTFRADYEAAKHDPSQWSSWLRLRLGVWLASEDSWLDTACPRGFADWDSGEYERTGNKKRIDCSTNYTLNDLAKIAKNSRSVTLGMDLASVRDTTALVLSVEDLAGLVWIWPWFFLPEREAIRQQKNVPYRIWAEEGHITLTPGDVCDYRTILNVAVSICDRFGVQRFYFDPLFQAEWLTQELESQTQATRVAFPQTIVHYTPIVKECERRIISHEIRHPNNPVLSWQIANAKAKEDANENKRLIKPKRGDYKKIDGAVAMLMSLKDAFADTDESDYYDENEVEVI